MLNLKSSILIILVYFAVISAKHLLNEKNNEKQRSSPVINPRIFKKSTLPKEVISTQLLSLEGANDLIEAHINSKRYYYMISGWDIFWFDEIFILKHHFSFDTFVYENQNLAFINDSLLLNTYESDPSGESGFIYIYDKKLDENYVDTNLRGVFGGICYDNNTDLIYINGLFYNQDLPKGNILVFNRNFSFIDTFTNSNIIGFLTVFDEKIYIENTTSIYVIDIKTKSVLSNILLGCNNVGRFSIDAKGNIVYACDNGTVNLIASNGTQIGEPIPIHTLDKIKLPKFATLDSEGKIIVGTEESLQIFF